MLVSFADTFSHKSAHTLRETTRYYKRKDGKFSNPQLCPAFGLAPMGDLKLVFNLAGNYSEKVN